jgi:hypothetical protein
MIGAGVCSEVPSASQGDYAPILGGPRSPTWASHSYRYKLDRLLLLFFRTDDV